MALIKNIESVPNDTIILHICQKIHLKGNLGKNYLNTSENPIIHDTTISH